MLIATALPRHQIVPFNLLYPLDNRENVPNASQKLSETLFSAIIFSHVYYCFSSGFLRNRIFAPKAKIIALKSVDHSPFSTPHLPHLYAKPFCFFNPTSGPTIRIVSQKWGVLLSINGSVDSWLTSSGCRVHEKQMFIYCNGGAL